MNLNKTIATIALLLLLVAMVLAAYGLRYVPISGNVFGSVMWDRWQQQACSISFQGLETKCIKP